MLRIERLQAPSFGVLGLVICALALALAIFAAVAPAPGTDGTEAQSDGVLYEVTGTEATVTGFDGEGEAVVIPSEVVIDGTTYTVTAISEEAFSGCTYLSSVEIPSTVTHIGERAFWDCTSLEEVTFYAGGTSPYVGYNAFPANDLGYILVYTDTDGVIDDGCLFTTPCYLDAREWDGPGIGETVTVDGIGYSVTSTFDLTAAVTECGGQEDIVIPETVEINGRTLTVVAISDYAFALAYDSVTVTVTIPSTVEHFDARQLMVCGSLEAVHVDPDNVSFSSADGVLYNGDATVLLTYPQGRQSDSFTVPETVRSISAFAVLSPYLTSIVLPEGLTAISDYGIVWCGSLTSITIPSNVTSIGTNFIDCPELESIYVESGNTTYSSMDGVLFDADGTELIRCPEARTGDYEVPESVMWISEYAFSNSGISSVSFPDGLVYIGAYAFYGCGNLETITIPGSVRAVEEYTLAFCGLREIVLEEGVEEIDVSFMTNNDNLWRVSFPTSIGFIRSYGELVATDEYSGKDILIDGSDTLVVTDGMFDCGDFSYRIISYDDMTVSITGFADNVSEVTSMVLPSEVWGFEVTEIGEGAFWIEDYTGLDIVIPNTVRVVGNYAFAAITADSIVIGEGVESIGYYAFEWSEMLSDKDVVIPDSVVSIGGYAFGSTNFEHIHIGAGVSDLDGSVFRDNRLGEDGFSVAMGGNYAVGENGVLYSADMKTAVSAPGLPTMEVSLHEGVESISVYAFYAANVTGTFGIPSTVTEIGEEAFEQSGVDRFEVAESNTVYSSDDQGLLMSADGKSVILCPPKLGGTIVLEDIDVLDGFQGSEVTRVQVYGNVGLVASGAFLDSYLESFVVSGSIDTVGESAFGRCYELHTFHAQGVRVIETYAFENVTAEHLDIPSDLEYLGEYVFDEDIAFVDRNGVPIDREHLAGHTFTFVDGSYVAVRQDTGWSFLQDGLWYTVVSSAQTYSLRSASSSDGLSAELTSHIPIDGSYSVMIPREVEFGLPLKVTSIAEGAFANSTGLTSVTFLDYGNITTIPAGAFEGCTNLTHVVIGEGVTTIEAGAFEGCGIQTVEFPLTILAVEEGAFDFDVPDRGLAGHTFVVVDDKAEPAANIEVVSLHGTYTSQGALAVGETVTLTFTPSDGYRITSVHVNGIDMGPASTVSFTLLENNIVRVSYERLAEEPDTPDYPVIVPGDDDPVVVPPQVTVVDGGSDGMSGIEKAVVIVLSVLTAAVVVMLVVALRRR